MSLTLSIAVPPPKALRFALLAVVSLFLIFTFLRIRGDSIFGELPYLNHQKIDYSTALSPPHATTNDVDWSRFAYVQYVTNGAYLCNSVMLFEILNRLHSKADRLLMYPANFDVNNDQSTEGRLLRKARDEYHVKLQPIQVQARSGGDSTWSESYTKLLAFNQTQYDRVLSLDSDSTVLQHMDELFLLPPVPVAIPRAYWLNFDDRVLSSQLVLIQPSEFEFNRVLTAMSEAKKDDYDMEIINNLYKDSAMILPHRPYNILTGEFRSKKHTDYIGNADEIWDPQVILNEAKFLHFSDWPVPKPWLAASDDIIREKQPTCDMNITSGQEDDCRAKDMWLGFYADFAQRRKSVCGLPSASKAKRGDDLPLLLPSAYEFVL